MSEPPILPDGSSFFVASLPLPTDHWLFAPGHERSPAPFRVGVGQMIGILLSREDLAEHIRTAGRYAYRASTMNGEAPDIDPDALVQNLIVGLLGSWTADGRDEFDPPGEP